jgi:hypothetical protein
MFTDPQTIKVAELRPGDFVVSYPRQANVPGRTIRSTVATIDDSYTRWAHQSAPRRPKLPIHSRIATFVTSTISALDLPADCIVIVRRPVQS